MLKNNNQPSNFNQAGLMAYKIYQQQQEQKTYKEPVETSYQNPTELEVPGETPDYLLPFDTLMISAKAGNVDAQLNVGIALRTGYLGNVIDAKEGESWIVKASKNQNKSPAVICAKGKCYDLVFGDVVAQRLDKAKENFQRAADAGNIPAIFELGRLLYDDSFIKSTETLTYRSRTQNIERTTIDGAKMKEAIQYITQAADAHYYPACDFLANCYIEGVGVDANKDSALKLLKTSVDTGISSGFAKKRLGDFYKNGWGGLKKDPKQAAKLYQQAADQGEDIGDRLHSSRCCTIS